MEFTERLNSLENSDIIQIIKSKNDYQKEFWEQAIDVAKTRGLNEEVDKILDELSKEEENQKIQDQKKLIEEQELLELYSEKVIIGFSMFFSVIGGSLLFAYNLKKMSQPEWWKAILIGCLYAAGVVVFMLLFSSFISRPYSYLINFVFSFIMTFHLCYKYYPEGLKYKNKSAVGVFLLGFSIIALIFLIYINKIIFY